MATAKERDPSYGAPSVLEGEAATATVSSNPDLNQNNTSFEKINMNEIRVSVAMNQHKRSTSLSNGNEFVPRLEQKITLLPSYPLLDTFSLLCILMIFPHWFSTITLILFVFVGNPESIDPILSLFLKHKLNRSNGLSNNSTLSTSNKSNHQNFTGFSSLSFLSCLLFDSIFMIIIFNFFPNLVPYIILFAKSLMASSLTSLRDRHLSDAFKSSFLLVFVEVTIMFTIKHFEIFRGDSISNSSSLSSMDILYPLYEGLEPSITKTLLFHLTFHKVDTNSLLMLQMEHTVQFIHSTLSLYLIMHNLNPKLREYQIINYIYSLFDFLTFSNEEIDSSISSKETTKKSSVLDEPKFQNSFSIPKKIAESSVPYKRGNFMVVNESNYKSKSTDIEYDGENQYLKTETETDTEKIIVKTNIDENDSDFDSENLPGWFPEDHQTSILNNVSSTSYVVAQNFETFCELIWSPSSQLIKTETVASKPISQSSSSTSNLDSQISLNSNSSLPRNKRNVFPHKLKNVSSNDKKTKVNVLKHQQPLWTFLNALRTMFSRKDYYSGDFYAYNAMVPTTAGMDDYIRNENASSQCFIWFTGETSLAFELHNISLEQLLIKVNGIIWEHVSACEFFGKELVFINGLSPLSQYDVDFVKITIHGELIHLTTATVSTIFQNKTVSESNVSTPLATLQESVKTTLAAIERERTKIKKSKQYWKKKLSQLNSEIDATIKTINTPETAKIENLLHDISQRDKEYSKIAEEFKKVTKIDADTQEKYFEVKQQYDNELLLFTKFSEESAKSIAGYEKTLKSRMNDKTAWLAKKEKHLLRKERYHGDVENLKNEIDKMKINEIESRIKKRKLRNDERDKKFQLFTEVLKSKTFS